MKIELVLLLVGILGCGSPRTEPPATSAETTDRQFQPPTVETAAQQAVVPVAETIGTAGKGRPEFLDVDQPAAVTHFGGRPGERLSQSFTTGPNTQLITAVELKTWEPSGTGDVVKVDVRKYEEPANWEGGTLLGSQVGSFEGLADGDWVRFQFDTPIPVQPNTLYNTFITNIKGHVGYRYDNTDPYPGGLQARWTPNWSRYFGNDLAFRVYGKTTRNSAVASASVSVADGESIVGIVLPETATPTEKHAGAELRHYLSVMTGQTLPTVSEPNRSTLIGRVIYIGQTRVGNGLVPDTGWGTETILIDTESGNDIVLTGGSDIGVLFSTYRFLRSLGCRWLSALSVGEGFDNIPRTAQIRVPARRLVSSPDFAVRGWAAPWAFSTVDTGPAQTDLGQILDWGVRNGLNAMSKPGPVDQGAHRGHGYIQLMGHTLGGLIPGGASDPQHQALYQAHPEYFPLVDGKRVASYKDGRAAQVCMSNPDVIQMASQGVLDYLHQHPDTRRYHVGQNDEPSYWCECSSCLALDAKDSPWRKNNASDAYAPNELRDSSPMSDRMIYFVNRIAEIVEKEFPDVYVSTYAYGSTVSPPRRWRPRKNVMIEYANAALCYQHAMSDSTCPQNKLWSAFLEGWTKFGNPVLIYDYEQCLTLHHHDTPTMWLTGLADYIRFAKQKGVYGWAGEGASHWIGSGISHYLKARLLWDVDQDLDELINDYCDHHYGSAGHTMKKYHTLLDAALQNGVGHAKRSLGILPPDKVAEADHLLQRALRVAERPASRHRVREARIAFLKLRLDQLQQAVQTDRQAFRQYEALVEETHHLLRDSQQTIMISAQFHANLAMLYQPPFEALAGKVLKQLPVEWKLKIDPRDEGEKLGWQRTDDLDGTWKPIRTDSSWTDQAYPGKYHGTAWYAVDFPIGDESGKLWLLFGAIDGDAWFWLNGVPAGRTTASPGVAWDKPFGLEITGTAHRGVANRLIVKVKKDRFAAGIWKRVKLVQQQ